MPYKVGDKGTYGCSGYPAVKDDGEVMGCHKTRAAASAQIYAINLSEGNIDKADMPMATEGDFVVAMTTEGTVVGQVEHVMREGGTYGEPGNPYAVESTPDNPAVAIRILEEENGVYYYSPYSIGTTMSNVMVIDRPEISTEKYEEDEEDDMEDMEEKGVGIKPPQAWPKTKRKRGGVGGNPAGATVSSGGSMGSKSIFADFGKDYTKTTRLENW